MSDSRRLRLAAEPKPTTKRHHEKAKLATTTVRRLHRASRDSQGPSQETAACTNQHTDSCNAGRSSGLAGAKTRSLSIEAGGGQDRAKPSAMAQDVAFDRSYVRALPLARTKRRVRLAYEPVDVEVHKPILDLEEARQLDPRQQVSIPRVGTREGGRALAGGGAARQPVTETRRAPRSASFGGCQLWSASPWP
jgi:hypothetical protein